MSDLEAALSPKLEMSQLQINLSSTGRPVMLAVPKDMTMGELLEFISWLTLADGFRATQQSPILAVRSLPGLS